jgi:type IV secretory pathway VirB10-like protein
MKSNMVKRVAAAGVAGLAGVAVGVTTVNLMSDDGDAGQVKTAAAQPAPARPAAAPVLPVAAPVVAPAIAAPAVAPKAVAKPGVKKPVPVVKVAPVVKEQQQRSPVRQAVQPPQATEKLKFVVVIPEKPVAPPAQSRLDKAKAAVDSAEKHVGEAEESLGQAKSKLKEAKSELDQARKEHKASKDKRDFGEKLREKHTEHQKKPGKVEVKLSSADAKPGESRTITKNTSNGSVSVSVTNGG